MRYGLCPPRGCSLVGRIIVLANCRAIVLKLMQIWDSCHGVGEPEGEMKGYAEGSGFRS